MNRLISTHTRPSPQSFPAQVTNFIHIQVIMTQKSLGNYPNMYLLSTLIKSCDYILACITHSEIGTIFNGLNSSWSMRKLMNHACERPPDITIHTLIRCLNCKAERQGLSGVESRRRGKLLSDGV